LWQIGRSLNHLIGRLTAFAQVDAVLGRTQQAVTALVDVIQRWQQGQSATLPSPSGTPVDPLIVLLQRTAAAPGGTRSHPTRPPPHPGRGARRAARPRPRAAPPPGKPCPPPPPMRSRGGKSSLTLGTAARSPSTGGRGHGRPAMPHVMACGRPPRRSP